ncbi:MAG: hypothetical protein IJT43_09290 [Stomatobaculum sp.]|nr:hypothetical protein [Stomatobaculum sp.]
MGFFSDNPFDPAYRIEDPVKDKKTGFRLEQFRFGEEAIYFPPQKYLPYAAVTGAEIIPTSFHVTGCCGKSLPAFAVKVSFGKEGRFASLVMEKKANAEKAKAFILGKKGKHSAVSEDNIVDFVEKSRNFTG